MTGLATIQTSLEQCYAAIESLAGRMDANGWRAQSLCPDWDMPGWQVRSVTGAQRYIIRGCRQQPGITAKVREALSPGSPVVAVANSAP